jgi:hypothetical protein
MFQRQQHSNAHSHNNNNNNNNDRYKWYNTVDDSVSTGHFPKDVYAHWTHYMASTFLYRSPPPSPPLPLPHCSPPSHHHYHKEEEEEVEEPDTIWTGIQGATKDGLPHIGRVPNFSLVAPPPPSLHEGEEDKVEKKKKQQLWLLAGFNGGGMSLIPLAAKAVAKMVVADLDFEDVKEEFGLLEGMGTGVGRMVG